MERNLKTVLILFIVLWVPFSCNKEDERQIYIRMQQWDDRLEQYPEAVLDSLRELGPGQLSPANRAYHGLLKTIADDKAYTEFTSDSLISEVVRYYGKYRPGTDDHIRSLIYQSVVRCRMGISDTTAYKSLKKAGQLFTASESQNPAIGYLLNFYLGDMNYKSGNYSVADIYYKESLHHAGLGKSDKHIFDVYTALFWNEMTREDYNRGKLCLDTLFAFRDMSDEIRYNILNMESAYYDIQGDFNRALQSEKEMQALLPSVKYKVDQFRNLFSISDKYKSLNQLDSAMYYGLQAIEHINDTTYQLNYLLYQNVADIALQQENYKMAEKYRRRTFEVYEYYVDEQTNQRILELEKQYDLTEAENRALKAKSKTRIVIILCVILFLSIALVLSIYYKHRKIAQLEKDKLEAEKRAIESEAELLQRRTEEQKNIIRICSSFLSLYSGQWHELKSFESKFSNNYNDKKKLEKNYTELLEKCQDDFEEKLARIFPSQMFDNIFHPCFAVSDFLIESDKLLLIMLALKLDNSQIAALSNILPSRLKARKSYIKKKIMENADKINDMGQILALF